MADHNAVNWSTETCDSFDNKNSYDWPGNRGCFNYRPPGPVPDFLQPPPPPPDKEKSAKDIRHSVPPPGTAPNAGFPPWQNEVDNFNMNNSANPNWTHSFQSFKNGPVPLMSMNLRRPNQWNNNHQSGKSIHNGNRFNKPWGNKSRTPKHKNMNTLNDKVKNGQMNKNIENKKNLKNTKNSDKAASEDPKFMCDACDRGYKDENAFKLHIQNHVKCSEAGCSYVAAAKLVALHYEWQHKTGLAKKIWQLESPEDIEKWRSERRRNFPTQARIEQKKQEMAERVARGEVIETQQFGKMQNRRGQRSDRGQNNRGRNRNPGKNQNQCQNRSNNKNVNQDQNTNDGKDHEFSQNSGGNAVQNTQDKVKSQEVQGSVSWPKKQELESFLKEARKELAEAQTAESTNQEQQGNSTIGNNSDRKRKRRDWFKNSKDKNKSTKLSPTKSKDETSETKPKTEMTTGDSKSLEQGNQSSSTSDDSSSESDTSDVEIVGCTEAPKPTPVAPEDVIIVDDESSDSSEYTDSSDDEEDEIPLKKIKTENETVDNTTSIEKETVPKITQKETETGEKTISKVNELVHQGSCQPKKSECSLSTSVTMASMGALGSLAAMYGDCSDSESETETPDNAAAVSARESKVISAPVQISKGIEDSSETSTVATQALSLQNKSAETPLQTSQQSCSNNLSSVMAIQDQNTTEDVKLSKKKKKRTKNKKLKKHSSGESNSNENPCNMVIKEEQTESLHDCGSVNCDHTQYNVKLKTEPINNDCEQSMKKENDEHLEHSDEESFTPNKSYTEGSPAKNDDSQKNGWKNKRKRNRRRKNKNNQTGNKQGGKVFKQTSSLLQKLLAPEIRHERNAIMQCIRHIVSNQFYGVPMCTNNNVHSKVTSQTPSNNAVSKDSA